MRTLLEHCALKAALLGVLLCATQAATAQAYVSAQRGAEIAPFAMTTLVSPDWGPNNNTGYTVGVDYTRFIRSIVQPSLEVRMTRANGATVDERSYGGGLKLQTSFRSIRPYGTLLVGHGNIKFIHPNGNYYGDSSLVYTIGGGADFNVTQSWRLRFDFTQQHWNFDPNTLTPMTFAVGIAYRVPFHTGAVR